MLDPESLASRQLERFMKMEISKNGPITIVKPFNRRMDAPSVVSFKAIMHDISESGATHIVLDMSRIEFMDSSGLGALISVLKRMSPEKVFEVSGLTPPVKKVFDLTHMNRIFNIHRTIDDAIVQEQERAT